MTTYKEIRGTHIVSVTSDPPSPQNGQMWYNSTDRVIKGLKILNVGAWATSTSMNTGRIYFDGSDLGTATATLVAGGEIPALTGNTETWNGSSWTEVNDLNTARSSHGGAGISTAALMFGGSSPPQVKITV